MGDLLNYVQTSKGVTLVSVVAIIIMFGYTMHNMFGVKIKDILLIIVKLLGRIIGKTINRKEKRYSRELEIGKITEKSRSNRIYRLLNDLTIDLGYKKKGVTPYEFLFFLLVGSALISFLVGALIFNSILMAILSYPMMFAGSACVMYTKANLAHDLRIEAVIDAENIICNNIEKGVEVAVRTSLLSMPMIVQDEFRDFLDNLQLKNFHIKVALEVLGNSLGSVSSSFISKCISYELEEQKGQAGIFKDVVFINNIKTEQRTDLKRKFEEIMMDFISGVLMIFIFLAGSIAIFPILQYFYFHNIVGQLLLVADFAIVIGEFVFITYLKAQEL